MNKKIIVMLMLGMFLISFASAFDSHKQNIDYDLTISHNTATSCQATWIKYPNGTQNILNQEMTKDGTTFYSTISSGNFSSLGTTCLGISCTDGSTSEVGSKCLDVTQNGERLDISSVLVYIIILSSFIMVGFILHLITKKSDLSKWENTLMAKYQNKNYIKLVLGSIGYNILKNPYVLYYLLGLPIILTLVDLSYAYSLGGLLDILKAILVIYFVGVIIVGLIFMSYVQEWFMDLLDKITNMEWGV